MQTLKEINTERVLFFDHIRYLMVFLVVGLHASCAYSNHMSHWAVNDANSDIFDLLLMLLGVFLMPVLFFVAGFFALPSLYTKGVTGFLKVKFIRLGIPLLLGLLFFGPIHKSIFYYSRQLGSFDLWTRFTDNIYSAIANHTGLISSRLQFHHHYFWFISLLLFFFIVLACFYQVKVLVLKGRFSSDDQKLSSGKSMLWTFFGIIITITLLTFVPGMLFFRDLNPRSWVLLGGVLMFQPAKIVLYIFCFGTGIYAYSKKWFSSIKISGHFMLWAGICLVLFIFYVVTGKRLSLNGPNGLDIFLMIFLRNALVFTILLALISFSTRFWNKASKVNNLFSQTSYHTYLLHMVFVLLLQLVLFKWLPVLSVFAKFWVVTVGAIVLSVLTAWYVTRPYPKLSVAGIVGGFVLLMTF